MNSDRLRPLNYPQTDLFIIMFDVLNPQSFDRVIEKWIPEVKENFKQDELPPMILVSSKMDLLKDGTAKTKLLLTQNELAIESDLAQKLAMEFGFFSHFELSSLDGSGFENLIPNLLKCFYLTESHKKKRCLIM